MDCIEIDLISIVRDCLLRAEDNANCVSPTYDDDNEWARAHFSTFNALIALEAARLGVPPAVLREQLSHPALRTRAALLASSEEFMAQPKHDAHVQAYYASGVYIPF